jgi:hypothetical protein
MRVYKYIINWGISFQASKVLYRLKYSTEQLSDINQNYNNSVGSSTLTKVYSIISQLP